MGGGAGGVGVAQCVSLHFLAFLSNLAPPSLPDLSGSQHEANLKHLYCPLVVSGRIGDVIRREGATNVVVFVLRARA